MRMSEPAEPAVPPSTHLYNQHGGSLNNLSIPGMRQKCLSEANLATIASRALSASNLAALTHKNLSLKPAISSQAYNNPKSLSAVAKASFEAKVRKYFYQLTTGCQRLGCRNKFCASCETSLSLTPDLATIMAIQLASRTRTCFCKPIMETEDGPYLPRSVFDQSRKQDTPTSSPLPPPSPKTYNQPITTDDNGSGTFTKTQTQHFELSEKSCKNTDRSGGGRSVGIGGYMVGKSIWNAYACTSQTTGGTKTSRKKQSKDTIRRPFLHSVFLSSPYKSLFEPQTGGGSCKKSETSANTDKTITTTTQVSGALGGVLGPSVVSSLSATIPSIGGDPIANMGVQVNISLASNIDLTHDKDGDLHCSNGTINGSNGGVNRSLGGRGISWKSKSAMDVRRVKRLSLSELDHIQTDSDALMSIQDFKIEADTKPENAANEVHRDLSGSNDEVYDFQPIPDEFEYIPGYTMDELEDVNELSLTHLSLPLLEDAIEIYHSTNDPSFLVNTIRTVFASPQCLGLSFRSEGTEQSKYESGVNLGDVRRAYNLILSLEPRDTFHRPLCNALEIIVAHLTHTSLSTSTLSQLLVILEFPELNVPTYHETLVRQLCWVVCELPGSSASTLRCWLSRLVPSHFTQYVEVFAQYVSVHFHAGQRPGKHVVAAVRSLQLLFEANELAEKELFRRVVDPALFYNDAVCRKIDYKQEFQLWRRSHSINRHGGKDGKTLPVRCGMRTSLPKISLFDFPFIIDPAGKSRVMHLDAVVQMSQVFEDAFVHSAWVFQAQKILEDSDARNIDVKGALKTATCPYLVLEIRREQLVHDTFAQLRNRKIQDIKKPLKIKWVGGGEEGLDMGGVQKEFFQSIFQNIFDVSVGMFSYCEETRLFWFNANSLETNREYEMVGLLLGLAIYNGVILDVKLPLVLYKKLMGRDPCLVDLKCLSPTLAKSIDILLEWDESQGDVEDVFCYTFQTMQDVYGTTKPINLKPNGDEIPVTNKNRREFVELYVDWLLNGSVAKQFESFSRGFHRMCGGKTLDLCIPEELELLICGSPELDFVALQENAMYDDGYGRDHTVIQWFWVIVDGFDEDQKKQLLNFVTGSDRVPINGLANMTFIIQRNGPDSDRLPTALTCFSRLLLPEYSTYTKLKNRLCVAIENGRGFGLV